MYENLRRNLNLKQMTVWTDEADPRFFEESKTAGHSDVLQLLFYYMLQKSMDMKSMRSIYLSPAK